MLNLCSNRIHGVNISNVINCSWFYTCRKAYCPQYRQCRLPWRKNTLSGHTKLVVTKGLEKHLQGTHQMCSKILSFCIVGP